MDQYLFRYGKFKQAELVHHIFPVEAFPEYQVEREEYKQGKGTIYTFFLNGQKKLVTEVVSCSTYRYALAKKCRQEGIPHLRYYYDYDGWWNTESYVVRRTAKYLGIDIKEIKA